MAIIGVSGKINSGKDTVGKIIQYLCSRENTTFQAWSIAQNNCKSDIVNKFYQGGWEIVKFADKLKDIVCILLGCTREQLEDRDFKETPLGEEWTKYYYISIIGIKSKYYNTYEDALKYCPSTFYLVETENLTPRQLLQYIGTDLFRKFIHENVWINATMSGYIKRPISIHSDSYPNWIITDVRFPNEADAITDKGGINIRIERKLDYEKHEQFNGDINNPIPTGIFKEHESETTLDNYEFTYVIDNNGTIEELIERVKEILLIEKII